MTALLDRAIGSLRRRLAAETERNLTLSMHMPTGCDPYFTPTMSVLDVYHFGTQHFDHHRRQLTLTSWFGQSATTSTSTSMLAMLRLAAYTARPNAGCASKTQAPPPWRP